MKKEEVIEITGQLIGLKNLKTVGGWRLEIDLYESKEKDILKTTLLVNRRAVVKIIFEEVPVAEKQDPKRSKGKTTPSKTRTFPV